MAQDNRETIISLLRFYIDTKQYSIVDRLAYATSPATARYALYEAVRQAQSARDRAIVATYKPKDSEKEYREVMCCYYEEMEGGSCDVGFPAQSGDKVYCCVPCPPIPDSNALASVLDAIERDISVATKLAALAMAYRPKRE